MSEPNNLGFVCQRIRLSGVVQGVGLRPLALRLAKELKLSGWVRNDAHGVEIEACGKPENVERLIERLHKDAPPLSRIDAIKSHLSDSISVSGEFFILDSRGGRAATMTAQDTAVCRNCLNDMFDPEGRRWRYAFTSCVHCGPRYSISRGLPFERLRTSLKPFVMCNKCQAEYRRPEDKRLLAETNCCPKCGPQLSLLNAEGETLPGDPIAEAYALLKAGKILAIKGPGGFHLACDAHNAVAVALLRERKSRQFKPFPVMLANALSATAYVQLSVGEPGLLNLPERPMILLRKRGQCDKALPGIAPGLAWLGVMLPSSPTHYLLFHEAAGRPAGTEWLDKAQGFALVMISANRNREPSMLDNEQALLNLSGIADAFLVNDCDVVTRCDDSIAYAGYGGFQLIRRARGYAPRAVKLLHAGPPILAVGAPAKNAVCLTRGDEAFVSQHIGQLTNPAACACFDETVAHLLKILEVSPSVLAYEHHRNSHPTRFALEFAHQRGIPTLGVQHHHAHIASVLAEHHVTGPIVSLSLDGGEIGTDGKIWGGELLRVDGARFERLGHFSPIKLPGSDRESRTPWRLAASIFHALGRDEEILRRFSEQPMAAALAEQLASGAECQSGSSLGRLFYAAAAILGVSPVSEFSGQAGLLLEGMAECHGEVSPLADAWTIKSGQLDLLPLFAILADEKNAERGAALFYATVAEALTQWLLTVVSKGDTVAAGGGSLQNQVLGRALRSRLGDYGLHLIEARRMPPNDGGLALGQAWIAQQYLLG